MRDEKKLIGGLIAGTLLGITKKLRDDLMASVNESIEGLRKQFIAKLDQMAEVG
jgi:hypothetical protein